VEAEILAQHDEQLEVIEVACGVALVPCAADIDDQASATLEDSVKLGGERLKPVDILVGLHVAVILLADQPEGRARHYGVHGIVIVDGAYVSAVTVDDLPQWRAVKRSDY